ncbi:MAG TPA: 50S ribosomal protein L10 [Clostridiales bacterium]|nr:50S ribosomal protein L10 [Clostridiales bacterium]
MSKFQDQKKEVVAEIKNKLKDAQAFVLVDYKGISVAQDTEMRAAFRENNVEYKVYKNRLLKIALNDLGYTDFDSALVGSTAIALTKTDEINAPAKIIKEKSTAWKKLEMKCGMVEGKYFNTAECMALAAMPSRQGLITQIASLLIAPISGLARALNAVAEQKEA